MLCIWYPRQVNQEHHMESFFLYAQLAGRKLNVPTQWSCKELAILYIVLSGFQKTVFQMENLKDSLFFGEAGYKVAYLYGSDAVKYL